MMWFFIFMGVMIGSIMADSGKKTCRGCNSADGGNDEYNVREEDDPKYRTW